MSNKTDHDTAAQACIGEVRALREKIPNFTFPKKKGERQAMSSLASLPPDFIKLTSSATRNTPVLTRGGYEPDAMDDLVSYADAYTPVADEVEVLLALLRHSIAAARATAGKEALATYAMTQRLATFPENGYLKPLVSLMSDALGRRKPKAKATEPLPPQPPQTT